MLINVKSNKIDTTGYGNFFVTNMQLHDIQLISGYGYCNLVTVQNTRSVTFNGLIISILYFWLRSYSKYLYNCYIRSVILLLIINMINNISNNICICIYSI